MKKGIIFSLVFTLVFLFGFKEAKADSPAYQPGVSCDTLNTTVSADTKVGSYDGTRVDVRIVPEGSTKIRCVWGNIFGAPPPINATSSVGFEISSTFDFYPYIPPTAEFHCAAETGTDTISVLFCHK